MATTISTLVFTLSTTVGQQAPITTLRESKRSMLATLSVGLLLVTLVMACLLVSPLGTNVPRWFRWLFLVLVILSLLLGEYVFRESLPLGQSPECSTCQSRQGSDTVLGCNQPRDNQ